MKELIKRENNLKKMAKEIFMNDNKHYSNLYSIICLDHFMEDGLTIKYLFYVPKFVIKKYPIKYYKNDLQDHQIDGIYEDELILKYKTLQRNKKLEEIGI